MALQTADKIWFDGKLVPWDQATVHVAAHVLHYGSSVFEGIRAYDVGGGPAAFCLDPHIDRMFDSAKILRMEIPYTREEIKQAISDTVAANRHKACYIRPLVFRGVNTLGVNPLPCPVHVVIITMQWGAYLGPEAIEQGVDVCVSSWQRRPRSAGSMSTRSSSSWRLSRMATWKESRWIPTASSVRGAARTSSL